MRASRGLDLRRRPHPFAGALPVPSVYGLLRRWCGRRGGSSRSAACQDGVAEARQGAQPQFVKEQRVRPALPRPVRQPPGAQRHGAGDAGAAGPRRVIHAAVRLCVAAVRLAARCLRLRLPRALRAARADAPARRGYYPDAPTKDNQDAFSVLPAFGGNPADHFFGVFDGHGEKGTQCAQFAAEKARATSSMRRPDRCALRPRAPRSRVPRRWGLGATVQRALLRVRGPKR